MSGVDRVAEITEGSIADRIRRSLPGRVIPSGFHALGVPAVDRMRVFTEGRETHGRPRK